MLLILDSSSDINDRMFKLQAPTLLTLPSNRCCNCQDGAEQSGRRREVTVLTCPLSFPLRRDDAHHEAGLAAKH